ncbi:MAG: DUF2069 domain-containing protein [Pseudohongiellaceae bacterium]
MTSFTEKAAHSRKIILVLLFLLILYYIWSHLMTGVDPVFRIIVSITPLLIFVPGIIYRKYKAASLLCFVLLLYFMVTVQSLFTPGNTFSESLAMIDIVILFTLTMFYSRWQQRADVLENVEPLTSEG